MEETQSVHDKMLNFEFLLQVSMNDQLPKVVCASCAYKLDEMFDFREKCLHTEGLFMEMLKEIKGEDGCVRSIQEMPVIQNSMERIGENMGSVQSCMEHMQNGDCVSNGDPNESSVHTMQVMDEMDLASDEQVVSQEEIGSQENDIQVAGIHCLDGETVRMVDEHIREVIHKKWTFFFQFFQQRSNLLDFFLQIMQKS